MSAAWVPLGTSGIARAHAEGVCGDLFRSGRVDVLLRTVT
ncbi:hypothetical protein FrEUN1fDRAFT_2099 [Parafrankia sp. EUN1f]|nr:hypothetical protein FrEUN1fDRAFT_2099 [Parafrankia sp. EUN1f]